MVKQAEEFKRGDSLTVTIEVPQGWITSDYTIKAQLRKPPVNDNDEATKVADFTITEVTNTMITLDILDTSSFPLGILAFDVQFTHKTTGRVSSTETVEVPVVRDYTQ